MNHDALIDRIARDMTDAEPRADFRARVLSHVAPRPRWPRLTIRAALVATAAAICAWALLPSNHITAPVERPNLGVRAMNDAASAPQPLQAVDQLETSRRPTRVHLIPRVSAEELAWRARAIPPLPPAQPLQVDSIQPQPLSIAPITVHPIVSDPLTLAAIDVRTGGRE
jgi:hypothetical protein